jgi:protein gp37
MAVKSSIEWTESTWNPITGCTKISTGCVNCYAERMAKRLKAMGQPNYINGFNVTMHNHLVDTPLHWKKPQTIFVNSMSDLFHENVPEDFILKIFDVMNNAHWHRFQILTKRSNRLATISYKLSWTSNIWMGVTVESADCKYRIDDLRNSGAFIKFLSIEPLLSSVGELDLENIDWVITGGESGPKARPIKIEWVREIRDQCKVNKIPFFFKQWGGTRKKKNGRILDGKLWDELPIRASFVQ